MASYKGLLQRHSGNTVTQPGVMVSAVISHYHILNKVGAGGMGEVSEFAGVDHNGATNTAYARADLIEWMLRQRRR